jgi:hypothetical protein
MMAAADSVPDTYALEKTYSHGSVAEIVAESAMGLVADSQKIVMVKPDSAEAEKSCPSLTFGDGSALFAATGPVTNPCGN